MKLEVREDSKNYACVVVKLPPKQAVQGLDKLVKVTVFGNDILTQKDTDENQLYLFFPAECEINSHYLGVNNEFRHSEKNSDRGKAGFFEDSGRVKAIKFKGVISTGYIAPAETLKDLTRFWSELREGNEFTDIDGINICKKYKVERTQGGPKDPKESRYNKKLKRFDKLVPNQFRFHQDTSQLARNLHQLDLEDIIVITDKWHGTSAVFSNVLVNVETKWYQRLVAAIAAPFIGKYISFVGYDQLYSSRSVIKNQYINKDQNGGYYGEDIWGVVNKELVGKIEQGITLYGEIVGYLPSGKMIQKDYDYNIDLNPTKDGSWPHRFVVYRITYTKPDGSVIEFSWQQIKDYCKKYSLETVKEFYFGKLKNVPGLQQVFWDQLDTDYLIKMLSLGYLEGNCKYCANKVPAEGICVRIDGRDSYMTYKLKSKRFLERETKQLDKGEEDIENVESVSSDTAQ